MRRSAAALKERWSYASGSTYQRIIFRRTLFAGVPTPPRTPGRRRSGRSAETGQRRSASSRAARRVSASPAPPGSAPQRRTSSRSASNNAATSTSSPATERAAGPLSLVSSGTHAFYPASPADPRPGVYDRPVRVALSLLTLVPGVSGGSETYARGLARGLASRAQVDVTAIVPPIAPDAGEGLSTEVATEWGQASSSAARAWAVGRASARAGRFRRRFEGVDVVHYPLTVPVPRVEARRVVTLHDVQHLDLPRLFSPATRAYRRVTYDGAARAADLVIVPSDFVRERAIARLGLDPQRVRAIPLGVDHERFAPGSAPRDAFLLYPARPWPHKNHERLLEAFSLLRAGRPDLRLVLCGVGSERFAGRPGVDALGAVPGPRLVDLLQRAACLVFPSLYEGFGSPPLEAMACGTPVAASTRGSIPEVCDGAAVLFDPEDPAAIAAGVEEALARTDELREAGRARAAEFTWERTAEAHEGAYRAVAA